MVQLLLVCARPVGPCAAVELHEHVEHLQDGEDVERPRVTADNLEKAAALLAAAVAGAAIRLAGAAAGDRCTTFYLDRQTQVLRKRRYAAVAWHSGGSQLRPRKSLFRKGKYMHPPRRGGHGAATSHRQGVRRIVESWWSHVQLNRLGNVRRPLPTRFAQVCARKHPHAFRAGRELAAHVKQKVESIYSHVGKMDLRIYHPASPARADKWCLCLSA